jgi:hypothetical protein
MTKTVLAWVRFAFTAPWALVGWLWCVLACLLQFADLKKLRFDGPGVLTSEWKPWFAKVYRYSTTIGRAIIFYPGSKERVRRHEQTHLDQVEDLMLLSFLVGLVVALTTGNWLLGFLLWFSGGAWQVPNFLMAMLRYGHHLKWPADGSFFGKLKQVLSDLFIGIAYRDSEHERSAYAQTDVGPDGLSWDDKREQLR